MPTHADGKARLALALASGSLYFLAAPAFGQGWLGWFVLVPLLFALDSAQLSLKHAAFLGWTFGFMAHLGLYTWLVSLFRQNLDLSLAASFGLYLLLCAAQGLAMGLFAWAVRWLARPATATPTAPVSMVWSVPVLFVLCEWLVPTPWPSHLASSQHQTLAMVQSLDLVGPLGVSFLLALTSAVVWAALRFLLRLGSKNQQKAPSIAMSLWAVLFCANLAYGWATLANVEDTTRLAVGAVLVGVVQPNVHAQDERLGFERGLRRQQQQTMELQRLGAELVIWPFAFDRLGMEGQSMASSPWLVGLDVPLIVGAHHRPNSKTTQPSGVLLHGSGPPSPLVLQQQYAPFLDDLALLSGLLPWANPVAHWQGQPANPRRVLEWRGVRYGVLLGSEDTLAATARHAALAGAEVLVSVTGSSDATKTNAPFVQLAMARMRAIEQRRFIVRSSNSGMSTVVAPTGRVQRSAPLGARANLLETIAPSGALTVYARLGNWLGGLLLVVLAWWRRDLAHPITGRLRSWFGLGQRRPTPKLADD